MLIIYQTATEQHISAHRDTTLRDLEQHAATAAPPALGNRWTAGPATADCRPDPGPRSNLIWKIYLHPQRYTVRHRNGLTYGADGPLHELISNPDITHVQPREVTEP